MNKLWRVLIVLTIFIQASHASAARAQKGLERDTHITVRDYLDREVTLSEPAQRIVALAPHIVENLYSAGAGDSIVGAVDYCDYPQAANKIPRVGAISSFSLEAILAAKPDLVIVWHSGRGGQVLEKLEQLQITAYASDPRKLEDIPRSIRDYGNLTGNAVTSEAVAQKFEDAHRELQKRYSSKASVSALYQVWNDPIQTLNGEHIISDVLRLCGGRNVFADAIPLAPKISIESMIERDPHLIIASGMGKERPDWLDAWKRWRELRAVRHNNLYYVPPDVIQRHTVRILDGAKMICNQIQTARHKTLTNQGTP